MTVTIRQVTDSSDIDDVLDGNYDEPVIEATDMPRAEFTVPLKSGIAAHKLAVGKEILIKRSGESAFPGYVTQSTPARGGARAGTLKVRAIHKGYQNLRRYQCDDLDFDEDGDPSTTRDGVTVNPWSFVILRESDSALDAYGNGYPVHGINVSDGIRAMCGTRFIYQHNFEDNSHLLASDIYATTNSLQVHRDGPSGDLRPSLQRVRKDGSGFHDNPAGGRIESIPLMNGDPNIRAMGAMGDVDVVLVGEAAMTSAYIQNLTLTAQDAFPTTQFFRADGLKMYVGGSENSSIYEYDLGTAFDISTATFLQSLDVSAQDSNPYAIFIRDDGLKMYFVGATNEDVYEYDLGTAWDISSATFLQSFDVTSEDTTPAGLFFRDDGLKMYVSGSANSNSIHEYDLGTAWDVSTATLLHSLDLTSVDAAPCGISISIDGERMWVVGDANDRVYKFKLTTPWNVTTALQIDSYDISPQDIILLGLFVSADEERMYVMGTDDILQYDFTTQDPVIEMCADAGLLISNALTNNTARNYSAVTLAHTANYNGSTLSAWTGSVNLSGATRAANYTESLGYRIRIAGTDGSATTTKIHYIALVATTVSDVDLTEGTVDAYDNGADLVDGEGTALRGGAVGDEQDWLEGDFLGMRRLEAIERIRTSTESDSTANTSPHWDFWIDGDLAFHFKERRGADKTREYSFDAENLLSIEHEYWGEEIAYQTIAYGPGSGSARTRIVNKRSFATGGLYDADKDPSTGSATEVELANIARVMEFVDSDETSIVALNRKARAYHKLRRSPIEKFDVSVLAEHIRFFETGDGVLVKDLPSRTNGTVRVVKLNRAFSGNQIERISLTLGENSPTIFSTNAGQSATQETLTIRGPPKESTSGLAGNGVYFDKDHFGVYAFGIPDGRAVDRVLLKMTTQPWQATSKTADFTAVSTAGGGNHNHGNISSSGTHSHSLSAQGAHTHALGDFSGGSGNTDTKGTIRTYNTPGVVNGESLTTGSYSTIVGLPPPGGLSWSDFDWVEVTVHHWNDSGDAHPWTGRLRGATSGAGNWGHDAATTSTGLTTDSVTYGYFSIILGPTELASYTGSETINVQGIATSVDFTDDMAVQAHYVRKHFHDRQDHTHAVGSSGTHSHSVSAQGAHTHTITDSGEHQHAISAVDVPLTFGIYQFDGTNGDGTGSPVYGSGIRLAVDPSIDAFSIPDDFANDRHPTSFGIYNRSQSVEIDVTGYMAVDPTSGVIANGEHRVYFQSIADAANGNASGLAVVGVTPIIVYKGVS